MATKDEALQQEYPVEWAQMIHYPDCWDTAAYPTLKDAIHESLAWIGCGKHKSAVQPLMDKFCITGMIDVGHHSLQLIFKSRKHAEEFKAAHGIGAQKEDA